jgi:autotransporter-associated beta strand protein
MQFTPTQFALKPNRLAIAVVMASLMQLGASPVFAASFTINADSTTAQTLGSASGQTGTVAAGHSLKVNGSTVAVTISGNNAALTNLGTISQTGTGRVIRDNTGVSGLMITNGSITNSTALMQAADADVIQMNKSPASVTLNNYGSLISLNASAGGNQAVDFNAILSGTNIINNYAGGLLKSYEADAVRPGVNGVVNNAGTIQSITTTGSSSDGIDAQTNSGITINNASTGIIEGGRHAITGGALDSSTNFTMTVNNSLGGIIRGMNGSGLNLDGFNANQVVTVVNGGLITGNGVTGDGDGVDVDGLVNITNTGIIRSINAYSAPSAGLAYSEGISVGGGTIINSGTIEGLVATGNTNAVGRGITLAGNDISSGPLAGTREALYGNAIITNQAGGLIRGQSDSAIVAVGAASQYTVTINNNAGAVILGGGATTAAIQTGLNNAVINNAGTINGASSGKAITFAGASNALYITGGSASVIGNISGAVGGTNTMVINPGTGNSFAYAGSVSNFNSVEVKSGNVTLSGANTYAGKTIVSGGTLTLDGANRISASSALELSGGTLAIANVNAANGQTFASLSLTDNSILNLGNTSLTFNGLGDVVGGKTLTITDYLASASPTYAFRVLGNFSADTSFQTLISGTTINGVGAKFQFDGVYTNVAAVPEPETYAMFIFGLGLIGFVARRRKQEEEMA